MKNFLLKLKRIFKKIKENDFLRFVIRFIETIFTIAIVLIIATILVQKFSKNNLSLGGYRLYTIISDSMKPKYKIGDMLLAKDVDVTELKVYDDIVYNGKVDDFAGKTVVHKIIQIKKINGQYEITTKGLANYMNDPTVYADQVIAKVVYKTKILSFISSIINNIYGFYFIVLVPFIVIIFIEIVRAIEEKKDNKRKKELERTEKEKKAKEEEEIL